MQNLHFSGSFSAEQNPVGHVSAYSHGVPMSGVRAGMFSTRNPGLCITDTCQGRAKTSRAPIRTASSHGGENWIWGREGAAGGKVNPSWRFTVGQRWGNGASSGCKA